jgi:hypothetical protein
MDQLEEKYHVCGMDNLYKSARLFCEAYAGENKVLCHEVARERGMDFQECDTRQSKEQEAARKSARYHKIRGSYRQPRGPRSSCFGIYDTKPVLEISMCNVPVKQSETGSFLYAMSD